MEKLKILIVEDNKVCLELYDKFLDNDVFEKQLVTNGRDGLEVYQSWKPDIIVLDMMLPLMSGYMVLKKIREEIRDRKTTIIMATSNAEKTDVTGCISLGIQGYIVKPFKPKEIAERILECYAQNKPEQDKVAKELLKKSNESPYKGRGFDMPVPPELLVIKMYGGFGYLLGIEDPKKSHTTRETVEKV